MSCRSEDFDVSFRNILKQLNNARDYQIRGLARSKRANVLEIARGTAGVTAEIVAEGLELEAHTLEIAFFNGARMTPNDLRDF